VDGSHSELGGLTQARFPGEAELTAREYIAVTTGTPLDQARRSHHTLMAKIHAK
jgi:hypothetical protein